MLYKCPAYTGRSDAFICYSMISTVDRVTPLSVHIITVYFLWWEQVKSILSVT